MASRHEARSPRPLGPPVQQRTRCSSSTPVPANALPAHSRGSAQRVDQPLAELEPVHLPRRLVRKPTAPPLLSAAASSSSERAMSESIVSAGAGSSQHITCARGRSWDLPDRRAPPIRLALLGRRREGGLHGVGPMANPELDLGRRQQRPRLGRRHPLPELLRSGRVRREQGLAVHPSGAGHWAATFLVVGARPPPSTSARDR